MPFIRSKRSGTLTANGDYLVSLVPGLLVLVEAGDVFGGAAVALKYQNINGGASEYIEDATPVTLTSGVAKLVRVTGKGGLVISVTGATGPTSIPYIVTPAAA